MRCSLTNMFRVIDVYLVCVYIWSAQREPLSTNTFSLQTKNTHITSDHPISFKIRLPTTPHFDVYLSLCLLLEICAISASNSKPFLDQFVTHFHCDPPDHRPLYVCFSIAKTTRLKTLTISITTIHKHAANHIRYRQTTMMLAIDVDGITIPSRPTFS